LVSTIKQSPIGFSGTLVEKPNFGFSENPRDMSGQATKEQCAQALNGYQDAVDEMESHLTKRKISRPFRHHLFADEHKEDLRT